MTGDWIGFKQLIEWAASTGILGGLIWYLEHKIQRREAIRDKKHEEEQAAADERSKKHGKTLEDILASSDAALEVSIATAHAVQRIPDAHCNGDMKAALEKAENIRAKKAEAYRAAYVQVNHEDAE